MVKFRQLILTIGLLTSLLGCNEQSVSQRSDSQDFPVILKLAVFSDGRLTVDGTPSTLPELQHSLQQLREQNGAVWYYRENAQQPAPPIAMDVMQAVVDAQVPIRMSTRPDYSDAFGSDSQPTTP